MSDLGKTMKQERDEERDSSDMQYKSTNFNEQFEEASPILGHHKTKNAEKSGTSCANAIIEIVGESTVTPMNFFAKSNLNQGGDNGTCNPQYKCKICYKQFEKASLLLRHHKTHSAEDSQSKILKAETANTVKDFAKTMLKQECYKNITPETLYTCNVCNKQFDKATILLRHQRTHSAEESPGNSCASDIKVKLETGNNTSIYSKTTIKHEDVVTEIQYTCNVCNKQFKKENILIRHQKTHSVKESQGNICKSDFAKTAVTANNVKHENEDTDAEIRYKCNVCHEQYKNASLLLRHQKLHDTEKPETICNNSETSAKKDQELYECSVNEYKTEITDNSEENEIMNRKKKPFECDICGYKAVALSLVKVHILGHYGVNVTKPYECHLCSFTCKRLDVLNLHLLRHTGEKPFKCNLCDFRTVNKMYLKTHVAVHNEHKPFECESCNFSTALKTNLRKHIMRRHTRDRPY